MIHRCSYIVALLACIASVALAAGECPKAPSKPTDRRTDKNSLRIMHYNAEWLFIDQYNNCPGSGCPWSNSTAAWAHLEAISSIVKQYNPDIVNFCEVEGCNELSNVIKEIGDDGYAPYLKQGADTSTGQNVGIITRIDPVESLWRTADTTAYPVAGSTCDAPGKTGSKGCSKHYFTSFSMNGMKIAMIGAHLLAYPDDQYRCLEREAQAATLRKVVDNYVNQGYEIIVLGDLNDYDGDADDAMGYKPISQVLDILKATGTKNELVNVAGFVEKPDRYSDWWDQNNDCKFEPHEVSLIDHVLLSPKLAAKVKQVKYAHDAYPQTCDTLYSDHWPIVIDFAF